MTPTAALRPDLLTAPRQNACRPVFQNGGRAGVFLDSLAAASL
jgi:hypothetical protein